MQDRGTSLEVNSGLKEGARLKSIMEQCPAPLRKEWAPEVSEVRVGCTVNAQPPPHLTTPNPPIGLTLHNPHSRRSTPRERCSPLHARAQPLLS